MRSVRLISVLGLCLALAGCGPGEPQGPIEPVRIGLYSSAKECASLGKLPMESCVKAIETAGNEHDTRSTLHRKLKLCEAEAGAGNCEAAGGNYYRPRLEAFVVVSQGSNVMARPLYANKGDAPFKDLDGKPYLVNDEQITISSSVHARAVAINPAADQGASAIADAASNIH